MTDSFQQLREIIQLADSSQFSEPCQRRLLDALGAVGTSYAPGRGDIASLVRHVLRREDELQGGNQALLKVPRIHPWPDRDTWEQSCMDVSFCQI